MTVGTKQRGALLNQAMPLRAIGLLICMVTLGAVVPATADALPNGPLVQFIDTHESEVHADISIEFTCSARYVTNLPASHGTSTTITLRLGPDCGTQLGLVPPELPLVGGGGQLVTGARLDSVVPGEYKLAVVDDGDLLIQGADGLEHYNQVIEMVKVLAGESTIRNPRIFKRQ